MYWNCLWTTNYHVCPYYVKYHIKNQNLLGWEKSYTKIAKKLKYVFNIYLFKFIKFLCVWVMCMLIVK